jgi:hypothetical protein
MKRLFLDCLTLASLAALAALPFWLVGREPFRPLIEALAVLFDYLGIAFHPQ